MTRDTSREAYRQIEAEGLLSQRRWEVYCALYEHGPLTGKELYRIMKRVKGNPDLHDTFQQRLSELQSQGVVKEVGEKQCSITGRNVILWDLTPHLPREFKKTKTKREVEINRAIEAERRACAAIAYQADDLIGRMIGDKITARG